MAIVRRCRSRLLASEWAGSQCTSCSGVSCARAAESCTVRLSDKPPRRRGEIRAREVGEREISHAPAHG